MATVIAAALPERLAARDDGGARTWRSGAAGPGAELAAGNALLSLATLGVYSFWGRTRVRRYLWGPRASRRAVRVQRHGRRALPRRTDRLWLVILPGLRLGDGPRHHLVLGYPLDAQGTPGSRIFSVLILFLLGLGRFRAVRYRLSRTSWRGIRGGLEGQGWAYAGAAFGHMLL